MAEGGGAVWRGGGGEVRGEGRDPLQRGQTGGASRRDVTPHQYKEEAAY